MALTNKLTAIANAIRGKTGKSDTLTLEQMATEIEGIEMTEELPKAEETAFGIDSGGNEYGIRTEGTASLHNEYENRTFGYAFTAVEAFSIVGFRHKQNSPGTTKRMRLWNNSGAVVRSMDVKDDASDWIDYYFDVPVNVAVGETYTVSVYAYRPSVMRFSYTVFNPKLTNIAIRYNSSNAYPSNNSGNYSSFAFVDIIIKPVQAELPDDYQITRTTMDDIAEEIQRITGATGKLSTAQIQDGLESVVLQEKSVTPTAEPQEVVPDSGYYGMSKVVVGACPTLPEPVVEPLTVTENGTYTPPEGVDGYNPVTVNVASSGGSEMEEQFIRAIEKDSGKLVTELPAGLTKIGGFAFYQCTNLALTSLPSGVTSIGENAFKGCTNLALTSLPDKLTSISDNAFRSCPELAITCLPDGITSIGVYSFSECSKFAITSIPTTVKSIGIYAFYYCRSLTEITFEGTPTSIATSAFNSCTNLLTINVPWAEGAVANAPWGATKATINYNYVGG